MSYLCNSTRHSYSGHGTGVALNFQRRRKNFPLLNPKAELPKEPGFAGAVNAGQRKQVVRNFLPRHYRPFPIRQFQQ